MKPLKFMISVFCCGVLLIAVSPLLAGVSGLLSEITKDIGIVFASTSIVTYAVQPRLERIFMMEMAGKIGVLNVYKNRDGLDLAAFFQGASRCIRILQTNLVSLVPLEEVIRKRQGSGVTVQILTCDLDSSFVEKRAPELDMSPEKFAQQMDVGLRAFAASKSLKVRTYMALPTMVMFQADDKLARCFISLNGRGLKNFHVEFTVSEGGIGTFFRDHFEKLWAHPDTKDFNL